jgi:short subunit dehydrogenase-like uncharacterized protein
MAPRGKPFDVLVFGATSFVGQILVRYLAHESATGGDLRWAIAGRSPSKLDAVRASCALPADRVPAFVANAEDTNALVGLCRQARVIVSTVGPYARHGEPLVRACCETGTDYCDLTGEVQWIRRMLARYEARARGTGARIVHCCGFDSIPSDLGVHVLQREARRRHGEACSAVKMRVKALRGALSGGTVASLLNVVQEVSSDPSLRRELADPYSLCPPGTAPRVRQPDIRFAEHDPDFDAWVAPFVMSAINTRIVHRTNALTGHPYGPDFRYDEATLTGKGLRGRLRAAALSMALGGFMVAGSLGPARRALERFVLPSPGDGPTAEQQRTGGFDLRFQGRTPSGNEVRVRVTGDRDPGYGSTAKMLGQAAACLAFDVPRETAGGFWTTASLFADHLPPRLRLRAGVQIEVLE